MNAVSAPDSLPRFVLYADAFVLGAALMGFEMLGSRYLNPYFGGTIATWAGLISTVLAALMIGYFAGGWLADHAPSSKMMGGLTCLAAAYMALVPAFASDALQAVLDHLGDGPLGILVAAVALLLFPLSLLGSFTPFAIRLLLDSTERSGRIAGRVYGVSTLGNILGTLATTFYLIPLMGTRAITFWFAVIVALCGLSLLAIRFRTPAAAFFLALMFSPQTAKAAPVDDDAHYVVVDNDAHYPESPLWRDGALYYAEMTEDRIVRLAGTRKSAFWSEAGCGPTSIAPYRKTEFLVLCHLAGKLVRLDRKGKKLGEMERDEKGERLLNPNDSDADGRGGVYLSASGHFTRSASAMGAVLHLAPDGKLRRLATGIHYANGVLLDPAHNRLLVSEHLGRKVLAYALLPDGSLGAASVFLDLDKSFPPAEHYYELAGPDGMERDPQGNIYIAEYGAGRLLIVSGEAKPLKVIPVPVPFLTNVGRAPDGTLYLTGAFNNSRQPYPGQVLRLAAPPP